MQFVAQNVAGMLGIECIGVFNNIFNAIHSPVINQLEVRYCAEEAVSVHILGDVVLNGACIG